MACNEAYLVISRWRNIVHDACVGYAVQCACHEVRLIGKGVEKWSQVVCGGTVFSCQNALPPNKKVVKGDRDVLVRKLEQTTRIFVHNAGVKAARKLRVVRVGHEKNGHAGDPGQRRVLYAVRVPDDPGKGSGVKVDGLDGGRRRWNHGNLCVHQRKGMQEKAQGCGGGGHFGAPDACRAEIWEGFTTRIIIPMLC